MAVEEAGPNPERLAAAIHDQLRLTSGRVPIRGIAEALDIVEIREEALQGLEGALVTPLDRNIGSVLLNMLSSSERRRFTLAHELLHFLNWWHMPTERSGGFACSRSDLSLGWRPPRGPSSRHVRQELEANRFAIELLAPSKYLQPYLHNIPDLAAVIDLAKLLDLSREAIARRYCELHPQPSAVVFTREGLVRYVDRSRRFPAVLCRKGQHLSSLPERVDGSGLSAHEEADSSDWLATANNRSLVIQTLSQQGGFAITLLAFDSSEANDEFDEDA